MRLLSIPAILALSCTSPASSPPEPGWATEDATGRVPTSEETGAAESSGAADSTGGAGSSSGGATTTDDAPSVVDVDDAWIARIEGAWLGPVDPTPMGPIPRFPLVFEAETDGSLHAFSGDDGMSFEFRFRRDGGHWVLDETGKLGPLEQSATLHPTALDGDTVHFETLDRPGYLAVDVTVHAAAFVMEVAVRGEPHAVFDLKRQ